MSLGRRIAEALGLRRSIVAVLVTAVLVGMGEQMAERFLGVYLLALGASQLLPGLLEGMNSGAGALYAYPGGYIAERLGMKRALLLFNLLAIAGYLVVIAIPHWLAVVLGSLLFVSWSSLSMPGTMGLIDKVLPKHQHVMGVSVHSIVRRVPKALGPLLGGALIVAWGEVTGVRLAFGVAVVMAVLAMFVQRALIEDDRPPAAPVRPDPNPFRMFRSFSPQLKHLFVADVLVRFCEKIPYAYVTIWCMRALPGETSPPVDAAQFGLLSAIEMITAILCYLPVARLTERAGKKPFVLITFVNFTLFPAVLFFSRDFGLLVVAFVIRGLKEFGEPTRKALILQLAPADRKAAAFGTYYLFRDSIIALAAIGGALLWYFDPAANLWCAFAFGVLGSLWFWLFSKSD